MSAIKIHWNTKDGTKIFAQYWAPEGETKAVVCQVHGFGEHSSRYDHVAELLNENGIALYGYDHYGHGKSEGGRGYIPNYDILMEEIDLCIDHAKAQFPDVPVFLYGHSWGGNITLNYLIRKKPHVKGAVVTGPWLRLYDEPGGFQQMLAKIMNVIWPSLAQNSNISVEELSYDTSVGEAYAEDPLVHGKITPRLFVCTTEAAEYALNNATQVTVPLLLAHGQDDKICHPQGTEDFVSKAGNLKNLSYKKYEKMRHEIHNELKKSLFLADMLKFLQDHLN